MYLQPIFSSDDIQKSLATFYKQFKKVDLKWKNNIMASRKGMVIEICNNHQLKNSLTDDIATLDRVQKNLEM